MAWQPVSTASMPVPAVLVVDDDPAIGELLVETLAAVGLTAEWCSSPEAALQTAAPGRFEAAVVDLQLPGMDGLSLIERLRLRDPDLQCLVLTGHASFDSAREGLRKGVFDYLCKADLGGGALERRVRQALERRRLDREQHELIVRLGTLAAAGAAIAAEPLIDGLLTQLVSSARGLCRADSARVLLVDRLADKSPEEAWVVRAAAGEGASELAGLPLGRGDRWAGEALASGATQLDPEARPRERPPGSCEQFDTARPGLIVAPFEHREVRGLLIVAGARRPPFAHGERDALGALARLGGVAIRNALEDEREQGIRARVDEFLSAMADGRSDPAWARQLADELSVRLRPRRREGS